MSYLQANYPYDEDISMGYGVWSADTLKKNWGETREDLKRKKMANLKT